MRAEKVTTIRMGSGTLKRIDGVARAMNRSRTWVVNQAIEHYLDYEEWFVGAVETGLKDVKSGRLVEHKAVLEKWERKRAAQVGSRR